MVPRIFGSVAASYDEEVPQAYEQISEAGNNNAANWMGSWMDNGSVFNTNILHLLLIVGGGSLAVSIAGSYAPNASDSHYY